MANGYVEYDSNNSGGRWWLNDQDWKNLEAAGWIVEWATLSPQYTDAGQYVRGDNGVPKLVPHEQCNSKYKLFVDPDGRYLGALAKGAYRVGLSLRDAAEEWEKVTGKSATDAGCPCCGQPHTFTQYDENGKYIKSGPETNYSAAW